jgi:hypothetical protein
MRFGDKLRADLIAAGILSPGDGEWRPARLLDRLTPEAFASMLRLDAAGRARAIRHINDGNRGETVFEFTAQDRDLDPRRIVNSPDSGAAVSSRDRKIA